MLQSYFKPEGLKTKSAENENSRPKVDSCFHLNQKSGKDKRTTICTQTGLAPSCLQKGQWFYLSKLSPDWISTTNIRQDSPIYFIYPWRYRKNIWPIIWSCDIKCASYMLISIFLLKYSYFSKIQIHVYIHVFHQPFPCDICLWTLRTQCWGKCSYSVKNAYGNDYKKINIEEINKNRINMPQETETSTRYKR